MAGTWADLVKQPGASVDTMLLLTDGTVIAHESDSPNWHQFTPTATGSYTSGKWTLLQPMPPNPAIAAANGGPTYGPLFFGSAVLGDGTVLVAGGEYNTGIQPGADMAAATRYDPVTSTWTNVATPAGWAHVGDVPLCVLADGRVLMGNIDTAQTALFDPATSRFTAGPAKGDRCAEESFTLLPDGSVLAVDCTAIPQAEKYLPASNTWVPAGNTPTTLPQACAGIVPEIGPTVLLPDGRAFVIGATGDTALYQPPANPADPGSWQAGPTILDGSGNRLHPIDAPAALLPNGRVLLAASPAPPCSFPGPTLFFEYDPGTNSLAAVGVPSNAGNACFTGRLLLLPNGQVLFSNQSSTVTIYTPDGSPDPAWRPAISAVAPTMAVGHHYLLEGERFNGLSQACCYGDDATMATNYPIARLEQGSKVFYCRTARHSTMAVATGNATVSTILSIPPAVPPGAYNLVVIANGIASAPTPVTIAAALPALAVDIEGGGHFGTVCARRSLQMQISNVGDLDLIVDQVFALPSAGAFDVAPLPAFPVTLKPGADIDVTITFTPATPGSASSGTIRITSNDPVSPVFDVPVSAATGAGRLAVAIADHGDFGDVCVGSVRDEALTLANTGNCRLHIIDVITSSTSFIAPQVSSYPIAIEAGAAIELPIRFQPAAPGSVHAVLSIFSDDPAGLKVLRVSGNAPAPRLSVISADGGDFGKVCLGSFADETVILSNGGTCALFVDSISASGPAFLAPHVQSYPIRIGAGDSVPVPVRFRPLAHGPVTATLTIASNDPASPAVLDLRGTAPGGSLRVCGSACFGGVPAGECEERTLTLCNVGDCHLEVTGVRFKRRSRHWKLVNNPFPARLHPGSCLAVGIRYKATEECPHCQALIIESDDPDTPVREIDVSASTIWDDDCRRREDGKTCAEAEERCRPPRRDCRCCDEDHADPDRDD